MYERFTDRARKVMQLAIQEAIRSNHEYIGTEHILLGLIKEGAGVAAHILKDFDLDVRKIRLEVEKIILPGPDLGTLDKLPQTPRAKSVIEHAIEEAKHLNHNYVGTEHLLLGLIGDGENVASQVLMNLGLKLEDIREDVLDLLGHKISEESVRRIIARCGMRSRRSQDGTSEESCNSPSQGETPLTAERERIRSLEQQLWNVRIVLGALAGALAGSLLAAGLGGVLGSIIGGIVAALGWRIPGALVGCVTGVLLGSAHLPSDGGGLAGALLGALAGLLIAEIGGPPERRGFANLWRKR